MTGRGNRSIRRSLRSGRSSRRRVNLVLGRERRERVGEGMVEAIEDVCVWVRGKDGRKGRDRNQSSHRASALQARTIMGSEDSRTAIRAIIVPLHCKRRTRMAVMGFVGYQARYKLQMHKLNYEAQYLRVYYTTRMNRLDH